MKKYWKKNYSILKIACMLGLGYAGYLIYENQDGITLSAGVAFVGCVLIVMALLSVSKRFFGARR